MVTRALVVEQDATLRETLELMLEDAGYVTVGVGEVGLARWALLVSPYPLVVLVGHGGPQVAGLSLVEQVGSLPPHAYLLLSTYPRAAPSAHNPHTKRTVPVVAVPDDVETLLARVAEAAGRLKRSMRARSAGMSARMACTC